MKISVVIRNKNQETALTFLLKNLVARYAEDVDEIVVIDNLSTDNSKQVAENYGCRFESIEQFSYGGSANFAASKASHPIVVIFSAHSYPVSHDFFKLIKERFKNNDKLAGLRCLHSSSDYRSYINEVSANEDPNKAGLIFSGSAIKKSVWEIIPFNENVATFEDKEWSTRVLKAGYEIDFVPSIFHYEIKRTKKQLYFRFKNDLIGNYQLWHQDVSFLSATKGFIATSFRLKVGLLVDLWYTLRRYIHTIKFIINKPKKL
ncbi:glycosyltransferase [Dokdonia donghaensis]|uniref:Glycosyl transferase family 2 n=1 Tax=Dokdonia donghaensis DSW-1 TaxID=1300343 RepID=A0A0A2GWN9_9FLAO|nr:glycosyltransferase [Dokdonia donghaensis]ANH60430.1 Glycosyl transferase family 2 [Dokdonia donghaensis DSW-1]KGO07699.1 glycosyl transferase family 2 [Dokdonia donghaensis DSW-1]